MSSNDPSRKRTRWESDEEEQEQDTRSRLKEKTQRAKSNVSTHLTGRTSISPGAPNTAGVSAARTPPPPPAAAAAIAIAQAKAKAAAAVASKKIASSVEGSTGTTYLTRCRHSSCYEKLNRIEEGSYGIVYRARDRETGDIVALKKLKLEKEKSGFPVTSLREIYTLLNAKHPNIVNVREIVMHRLDQVFIVMDFIEHDLKTLMTEMRTPFLQSEVKTLMLQLLSAVKLLHDNWIVHRDLKTSNLLLNNRGEIKVADFGLARKFGSPLGRMTQLVVTLWYRAPELLLGAKEYTTAIDMWSIGCIFAELINNEPLLPGRSEIDQIDKIVKLLGNPTEEIWPGFSELPHAKNIGKKQDYSTLRSRFTYLTEAGMDLLSRMLTYNPAERITAEDALNHPYFSESPPPKDPALFPTWPSKGSGERHHRKKSFSPSAPQAAHAALDEQDEGLAGTLFAGQADTAGFRLKLG
ncbi:Pkinase-domain-containing protein [Syncephalastrum racemosum]|uniref:cyclin-dependent kinase n=1 Tax=Syncephalastrum racemosum TaxID=13706 RepID=A0A1X2HSM3_SYNRA|nr:Pkinase-domain-containing protein [Syncephalastrum racemosum]